MRCSSSATGESLNLAKHFVTHLRGATCKMRAKDCMSQNKSSRLNPQLAAAYSRSGTVRLSLACILGGMVLGVVVGIVFGERAAGLAIPSRPRAALTRRASATADLDRDHQSADGSGLREVGTAGKLIRLLVLNTVVAICVGLVVANVLRPGSWSAAAQAAGPR